MVGAAFFVLARSRLIPIGARVGETEQQSGTLAALARTATVPGCTHA